ncbi:hypothetical protein GGI25_003418 [Coemansia spiralis]|uniref:RING-type E3 ubiquitin transferase n=2 Tax=Coemansia TaxID=4863 RepID=A0A9W8G856_9FUNG|nr:hypothetical protein EDC05_001676 [Coemansia umbellata]KAJ2621226.1 hypothetical protein GGI26_004299 [Coemansia sp. RSA 1358]KAJ2676773.1 hypothetical protein GGI25_003418 [Coemansia spiralis]
MNGTDSSSAPTIASISMRFKGFNSWDEWYRHSRGNQTITPITSFTGILNGATNSVFALYKATRIVLLISAGVLKMSLGVEISDQTFTAATETIVEFLAKSFEGMVMTIAAVLVFLALFILHDWIVTNAPAENNIVEEVEEQIAQEQNAQQLAARNRAAAQDQDVQPQPDPAVNRFQAQARPIVAENPQNRPVFELPDFELPILDDLPPEERPIRPQRQPQRQLEQTETNSPNSDNHSSFWTSASSASEDEHDYAVLSAYDTNQPAEANEDEQARDILLAASASASNVSRLSPSSSELRSVWAYAEEAFDDDASVTSSSADMISDIDEHSYLHTREANNNAGSFNSSNNDGRGNVRHIDVAIEHTPYLEHSATKDVPSDVKGKSHIRNLEVVSSTQHQTESNRTSWSFVLSESSKQSDLSQLDVAESSKQSRQNHSNDDNLPPTFTCERSRSILGHAHISGSEDNASNSDRGSYEDTSSDHDEDDSMLPYAQRVAALRQLQADRQWQMLQQGQVLAPNPRPDVEFEGPNQPERQPPLQAMRDDAVFNANPIVVQENNNALNGNVAPGNDADNMDDNFGDFEAADGILEAAGFRGPLFNAVQYFILALLMVGIVLASSAWFPFILAQAFVLLNPVRVVLYIIHVFSVVIDTIEEAILDIAIPLVWKPIRPFLVFVVNTLGPFAAFGISFLVPGIKDALSASNGSFWDKLTSPSVQILFLASLQQSSIIQLLFPWIHTTPTRTVAGNAAAYTGLPVASDNYNIAIEAATGAAKQASFIATLYGYITWPITYVLSWISWVVDGAYGTICSFFATPTTDVREISTSLPLYTWERELWQRFVGFGIPVDNIVARLQQATTGSSLDDRMLMISIGHLLGIFLAWAAVTYTPRALRDTALYSSAKKFLLMAKIVLFISIELLLFPVLCGYCLDISLLPLLDASSSVSSRFSALADQKWTMLVMHWMLGMFFMVHFARFVLHLRQVVRPGLLWFIRDPSDPNFHPIRDIIEDKMLPQQYNIARSALMYGGIILACVGLSMFATVNAAPKVFPVQWDSTMQFSEYPVRVMTPIFLLPVVIMRGRPNEVLHFIFSWWWKIAAQMVRLSEFIVGKRSIVDEGTWVILNAPWIPGALVWPFMPLQIVKEVFNAFDEHVFDEARVGAVEGAIPTSEYRARLQLAIDIALAQHYPNFAFVLDGQNIRAPKVDTVPVVAGRRMLVPVDNHGRPAEDRFDYEAADYPEIRDMDENHNRDLPPPAPESSYRDRRFKPDQYSVLYIPPNLRTRVIAFFALGWTAIAVVSGMTLALSLVIGRAIYIRLGDLPRHDVYALAIGLLVLLAVTVTVYRLLLQISKLIGRDADRAAALQRLKRHAAQAGTAILKSIVCAVVFGGVVPAVYGLVVEVYFVVLFRDYIIKTGAVDVLARPLWQAMIHNWMFGILHVWVGTSVLRFFPGWQWTRQMDRLFTGPPHTWHVWEGIKVFAYPIIWRSLMSVCLPFALAILVMLGKNSLTTETLIDLLMLNNVDILAMCSKIVLLAVIAFGATWQACFMYKRWTRLARDRAYLVGQQLHNLNANDNERHTAGDHPPIAHDVVDNPVVPPPAVVADAAIHGEGNA